MANRILVIAEHRDGNLKLISKEAMTMAHGLDGWEVVSVVLGSGVDAIAADLATWGGTRTIAIESPKLAQYTPEAYVAALSELIEDLKPTAIVTGHSYQAIDFFPRLAAAVDGALIPDVTSVAEVDGKLRCARKVINGKLETHCDPVGDGPWLISLQQGAFPAQSPGATADVETRNPDLSQVVTREIVSIEAAEAGEVDLTAADIIVAGGRGVGGEKFKVVFDLADAMGAAVGASRPPCDSEWVEHERQIGSSGQVVAPKLYVAVGISGAIQHLVGMRGSQCIVAINKDPNAAIFQEATYGIVGDLHEVVPALIEAVNEAKES